MGGNTNVEEVRDGEAVAMVYCDFSDPEGG